jgi:arabinan endo-1,5-alpha-L-arabinosidase
MLKRQPESTHKSGRSSKKHLVAAFVLASLCLVTIAYASFWQLWGELVTHDPTIYKEGSLWWIAETSDSGIGIKYSPNGHTWTQGIPIYGDGLSWWKSYNGNSDSTWAGDIHDWNGRAICFYAVSTFGSQNSAIGLTTASSIIKGNWSDKGAVLTSDNSTPYNAIDPNFVVDESGLPWLAFGSWWQGIFITRLDPTTLRPIGKKYNIAEDDQGIEGSYIVTRDGFYYLFVSKGTCCSGAESTYHICYGRSKSITGPYLDQGGRNMLYKGGDTLYSGNTRYIAPGGQSLYNNNGDWVIAGHELDSRNDYVPVLFINDLYWVDGWPSLY